MYIRRQERSQEGGCAAVSRRQNLCDVDSQSPGICCSGAPSETTPVASPGTTAIPTPTGSPWTSGEAGVAAGSTASPAPTTVSASVVPGAATPSPPSPAERAGAGAGPAAPAGIGFPTGAIVGILCAFLAVLICVAVWYRACQRARHGQPQSVSKAQGRSGEPENLSPAWGLGQHGPAFVERRGRAGGRTSPRPGPRFAGQPPPLHGYSATRRVCRTAAHAGNQQPGSQARWETPWETRCQIRCTAVPLQAARRSKAHSDTVSPISPGSKHSSLFATTDGAAQMGTGRGQKSDPVRNVCGSRHSVAGRGTRLDSPRPTTPTAVQMLSPERQQPLSPLLRVEAEPKYELDGREISSVVEGAEDAGLRPPPLRLQSHSGWRPQPLARSASENSGALPSPAPRARLAHSRSVAGQTGHRWRPNRALPQPRATLRATKDEVERGVHAGSWSWLKPV